MYITNITDYYNNSLSTNINCTNSENNIEIIIPLNTIIPYGMSLICLISLMIYVSIKPFSIKNENTCNYTYYSYMNTCKDTRKYLSTYNKV